MGHSFVPVLGLRVLHALSVLILTKPGKFWLIWSPVEEAEPLQPPDWDDRQLACHHTFFTPKTLNLLPAIFQQFPDWRGLPVIGIQGCSLQWDSNCQGGWICRATGQFFLGGCEQLNSYQKAARLDGTQSTEHLSLGPFRPPTCGIHIQSPAGGLGTSEPPGSSHPSNITGCTRLLSSCFSSSSLSAANTTV